MQDFRDLRVWVLAHEVTLAVYRITAAFPREELFGLTSQIRRSAASIPANLAEGCGRNGNAEFARFCSIAMGSASELDYHLLLATRICPRK
jgi:four helix bundle protein